MKLQKLHLFLLLLGVLIFGCLGANVVEGLESQEDGTENTADEDNSNQSPEESSLLQNNSDSGDLGTYGNAQEDGNLTDPQQPNYSNNMESSQGSSASNIRPGDEDLYVLKSTIVPPVCPACPTNATCPRQEPCQPCPPCARCPEPSFECKKVPNYNAANPDMLPQPLLTDFSRFGM